MIASPGPSAYTSLIEKFWQMVIQNNVRHILTLCHNLNFDCGNYLPNLENDNTENHLHFGEVMILNLTHKTVRTPHYVSRTVEVH